MPVSVQFKAKDNLLKEKVKKEICLSCNTCALVDPVQYAEGFSCTETFIKDVFSASPPEKNPRIWMCVSCHKCDEICPYEVKPVEVIEALKADAFQKGCAPKFIQEEINHIITSGYAFPIFQSLNYINRLRNKLGLSELQERKVDEIRLIIKKTGFENKLPEEKKSDE